LSYQKNVIVESTVFPLRNIHKYTWTSPDRQTHNHIDHVLIVKRRHSNVVNVGSFRGAVILMQTLQTDCQWVNREFWSLIYSDVISRN